MVQGNNFNSNFFKATNTNVSQETSQTTGTVRKSSISRGRDISKGTDDYKMSVVKKIRLVFIKVLEKASEIKKNVRRIKGKILKKAI